MTRVVQNILTAVALGLFALLALLLVFQMAEWAPLRNFGGAILAGIPPGLQMTILIVGILLVLAVLVLAILQMRREKYITKTSENGTVTISESAITRYIRQVAKEVESVRSVRTRILNGRAGMIVDIYANVLVSDTLPRIEQTIRSRVREALERTLGVGGVESINVVIEGFQKIGAPTGASTQHKVSAPKAETPPAVAPGVSPTAGTVAPTITVEEETVRAKAARTDIKSIEHLSATETPVVKDEPEARVLPAEPPEGLAAPVGEAPPPTGETSAWGPAGASEGEAQDITPPSGEVGEHVTAPVGRTGEDITPGPEPIEPERDVANESETQAAETERTERHP